MWSKSLLHIVVLVELQLGRQLAWCVVTVRVVHTGDSKLLKTPAALDMRVVISLSNVVSWDRTLPRYWKLETTSIWLSLMKKDGGETGDEVDNGKPLCCITKLDDVAFGD